MPILDYRTAGESHGPALTVLIEGMPAGVPMDWEWINAELRRRQGGYGRGGRMKIERDEVNAVAGLRHGLTMGSPLVLQIVNHDSRLDETPAVHRPRPGHADLAGSRKWMTDDCRETLERASARETAARVAAGGVARCLLREIGVEAFGFVQSIGGVESSDLEPSVGNAADLAALRVRRDANEVFCLDELAASKMIAAIHQVMTQKDTIGGVVVAHVYGVPPGIGSCMRWQDKLDGRLLGAVGSIQAIKGVEIGRGFASARLPGSQVHDAIEWDAGLMHTHRVGFRRRSNSAGGLEGGMSNGETIVVRAAMKPISTLLQGMDSVNLTTKAAERSDYERSDICAVPAASVVVENVVAFEVARAMCEKFAGDTLREFRNAFDYYLSALRNLGSPNS